MTSREVRNRFTAVSDHIYVGTQGWNYDAWVGPFYPINTRPADFLPVYSRAFTTVEVDSTFYGTPADSTFESWAHRTPPEFIFSLKMPQEVTHEQRLRDVTGASQLFYEGARRLGEKLGPVLVQLGPDFLPNELPALVDFIGRVPDDMRFVVEFRHRGWINDGVLALLRDRNIALALVEGRWIPRKIMLSLAARPTANFLYVRLMGPNRDLVDYSRVQVDRTREIDAWTDAMLAAASQVKSVFAYVANTFTGHSPATVRYMQRRLGQTPVDPEALGEQLSFF